MLLARSWPNIRQSDKSLFAVSLGLTPFYLAVKSDISLYCSKMAVGRTEIANLNDNKQGLTGFRGICRN